MYCGPRIRPMAPGVCTRPGGRYLPLPLHFAQAKRTSLMPWQFVQRSFPWPRQFAQTAAALIDFDIAARCSLIAALTTAIDRNPLEALSKPFFFAYAMQVRA